MNLITAIDRARAILNEPLASTRAFPDDTSSFWTDTALTSFFNLVQDEIQNEIVQSDEMYFSTQTFLNITNGCADYAIPSGSIKLIRLEDARGTGRPVEIRPTTINNTEEMGISDYVSSTLNLNGDTYYLKGELLVLTNTPNFTNASAIRLHYVRKLTDLSTSGAVSEIPVEHHHCLVWGIVKYALWSQQTTDTGPVDREYEKRLKKVTAQVENRQIQRPRRVKITQNDVD